MQTIKITLCALIKLWDKLYEIIRRLVSGVVVPCSIRQSRLSVKAFFTSFSECTHDGFGSALETG